jgi:cyclopropane fatty-acyl-phospholipid synthase-like methyltransferase
VSDVDLPYLDTLIELLTAQPSGMHRALKRNVHWGLFEDGDDLSIDSYLRAAERLTLRVFDLADLRSGTRILDVGCGFGGTIQYLDETWSDCVMVGLNIDDRQLKRADIEPSGRNVVRLLNGDACGMPLRAQSIDIMLAIECIFHFSSRKRFFREAARLLVPGGRLVFSDFVLNRAKFTELGRWLQQDRVQDAKFFSANGEPVTSLAYERHARSSGLRLVANEDITKQTLPTYPVLRNLYSDLGVGAAIGALDLLEEAASNELLQYRLIACEASARR